MNSKVQKPYNLIKISFIVFFITALIMMSLIFKAGVDLSKVELRKEKFSELSNKLVDAINKQSDKSFNYYEISNRLDTYKSIQKDIASIGEIDSNINVDVADIKQITKVSNNIKTKPKQLKNLWTEYISNIKSFYKFSKKNNWKNLSRVSQRIYLRTPNKFKFEKDINYLLGVNQKDLSLLYEITSSSTLESDRKKEIVDRYDKINTLTNLLIEKNSEVSQTRNAYYLLASNFKDWGKKWNKNWKNYSNQKSESTIFQSYFTLFLYFLPLILLGLFVTFVSRKTLQSIEDLEEKRIITALDNIVVKSNLDFSKDKSENFKNATKRIDDFIKRRVSLGFIFQDTLPFPCVLLDDNLNFKWFNDKFTDEFNYKDLSNARENVWDDLKEKLQLQDQDPILESLQTGLSGIYNVTSSRDKTTYQLYVNPIEYKQASYVIIYFYPLFSIDESTKIQRKMFVSPVLEVIDNFIDQDFSEKISSSVEGQFIGNETTELLSAFEDLRGYILSKFRSLEQKVQLLENFSEELNQNQSSYLEQSHKKQEVLNDLKDTSLNFKNELIKLFETRGSLEQVYSSRDQQLDFLLKNSNTNINDEKKLTSSLKKLTDWGLPSLNEFKIQIKDIKDRVKGPEEYKILTSVDVFLSKFSMLLEDINNLGQSSKIDTILERLASFKESYLSQENSFDHLRSEVSDTESKIIDLLQGLFSSVKKANHYEGFTVDSFKDRQENQTIL